MNYFKSRKDLRMGSLALFTAAFFMLSATLLTGQTPNLHLQGNVSENVEFNDGFEDGSIAPFTTAGNATWSVQSLEAFQGTFSARSGLIGDAQSSYIELALNKAEPTRLSFALKVSSQFFLDELIFSINGDDVLTESGELPWTTHTYYLESGINTLRWTYAKDSSTVSGSDAAWLDSVLLTSMDGQVIRIQDGTEGFGKILTSDAHGHGVWATPEMLIQEYNTPLDLQDNISILPYLLSNERTGAPLMLRNTAPFGAGLLVDKSFFGMIIDSTTSTGLLMQGSLGNGIEVHGSGGNGLYIVDTQSPSIFISNSMSSGIRMINPLLRGIYITGSGNEGIYLENCGGTEEAIGIFNAGNTGIYMVSPGGSGVEIYDPVDDGFHVQRPGVNGLTIVNAAQHGIVVVGSDETAVDIVHDSSDYVAGNWAGRFVGDLYADFLAKGAGAFFIDHPLEPEDKYLAHSFVESPDMMNVYNGNAELDENGEAVVQMPAYFDALNRDFRYQLTPIGAAAVLYIADEIQSNSFRIAGGEPGMKVSWQVTGNRKDPYAEHNRLEVEIEKPDTLKGKYLHPEAWSKRLGVESLTPIHQVRTGMLEKDPQKDSEKPEEKSVSALDKH